MSSAVEARAAEPGRQPEGAFDRLIRLVDDDMREVDRTIIARMASPVELIPRLATYIVAAGGKRLRPLLTLACSRLCGYQGSRAIGLAAAVEFIHTATLLHDDVVDESDLRRGQASANEVFGNKSSVLVGDFLFSRAFELMVEDGSLEVLRLLSRASAVIAEGEVLQLAAANDTGTTEAVYLDVVRAKTAELFAAACRIGAVLADRSPAEGEALAEFGGNLGIAFQLVDDVLDFSAAEARLGKSVGDDFREGKITLPIILAHAEGTAEEREFWRRTLERQDICDGDFERAAEILRRRGALDRTIARARGYGARARAALARLPSGELNDALAGVVEFSIERDH